MYRTERWRKRENKTLREKLHKSRVMSVLLTPLSFLMSFPKLNNNGELSIIFRNGIATETGCYWKTCEHNPNLTIGPQKLILQLSNLTNLSSLCHCRSSPGNRGTFLSFDNFYLGKQLYWRSFFSSVIYRELQVYSFNVIETVG